MVSLEVSDGVAQLRLARPDRHNAIDPALVAALAGAVERVALDTSLRALLIGADGPSFTVGGDLAHFSAHADDLAVELDAMIGTFHESLTRLADLRMPVVCAAQGAAAGGGLGLLWCADVVLAADDLKIATGFDRLGLSGDGGSSWALPRLVGPRRARQLLLGGRTLDAAEALEWGLVDQVVGVDELAVAAVAEARRLAAGPTAAYAQIKQLLRSSEHASWSEQLAAEHAAIVACGRTHDAREGIESFVQRRAPAFRGR
jgi:2-(1,2-epoxy-1,2-dihydrophenyl)acetyl-CoA isomerase